MEKVELDEFEKLLGEIPNVTHANPSSEKSDIAYIQDQLGRLALDGAVNRDSANNPFYGNGELHSGVSNERHGNFNGHRQSTYLRDRLEESNLTGDQIKAQGFAGLSFVNGANMESAMPRLANFAGTRYQPASVNGEHMDSLEKFPSNMRSRSMVIHPPTLPHNVSNGYFSNNDGEFINQEHFYYQPIFSSMGAVPLAHAMQSFRSQSSVICPGIEFPVTSNQHLCLDAPSLPCFHQPVRQSQVPWIYLDEKNGRMHQQYLYMKQFQNQTPIQGNWSTTRNVINRSTVQPCGNKYNSYIDQHYVQEPSWEEVSNSRCTYPSNSVLPCVAFKGSQVLDEPKKHFYAERKLTRPQKFQSLKPGQIGHPSKPNQYENVRLNNSPPMSFIATRNVEFQYERLTSRGSLDENDNNQKLPHWKENTMIDTLNKKIYGMAKNQNGCRLLQRKIDEGTLEDVEMIFTAIITQVAELMTDPFGNYLVQKLLEVCNEHQKMQILHQITKNRGDLVRISCDMHGTRAVQKVIENLRTPEQFSMVVSSLKLGIIHLIKNTNGNHVAQGCLQNLTSEYTRFLLEAVASNCVELAMDRHGCCVVQKCLRHSEYEQRHHLIKEITSNSLFLSQDQFGNYVVQFIFDIHLPWATTEILDQLEGSYGDLSVQKYSSNVVEKCLKHAGEERRKCIIQELMSNPRLGHIMQDPYGNFVIQVAINLSKGSLRTALTKAVEAHVSMLKTSPYGKKVLSCYNLKK